MAHPYKSRLAHCIWISITGSRKAFGRSTINLASNIIKKAKLHNRRWLRQHGLIINRHPVVVFLESNFANNHDYGTQLAEKILLSDDKERVSCVSFSSKQHKRVVKSVLSGNLPVHRLFFIRRLWWCTTWSKQRTKEFHRLYLEIRKVCLRWL